MSRKECKSGTGRGVWKGGCRMECSRASWVEGGGMLGGRCGIVGVISDIVGGGLSCMVLGVAT